MNTTEEIKSARIAEIKRQFEVSRNNEIERHLQNIKEIIEERSFNLEDEKEEMIDGLYDMIKIQPVSIESTIEQIQRQLDMIKKVRT